MSLISIIIPVYNTEKYLPKCLDSILENDTRDIEIIIVDDGSLGKCSEVVENYRTKISNIKYIKLLENKGIFAAQSVGIKEAKSKYIMFINSDDYIEKNTIREIVAELKNGYDIIAFNYVYENENNRRESPYYEYEINKNLVINDKVANIEKLFLHRLINLTSKVIKKELLDKIETEDRHINYLNGYLKTIKLFYYAKNIKYITNPYYICKKRINSTTNLTNISFNQKEHILNNLAYISDSVYAFLRENEIFDLLKTHIEYFEYETYNLMYTNIIQNNKNRIKYIDNLFAKALPSIKKYIDILEKIENAKLIKPSISLSIVIPVFNTEIYLPRCLDSILNQTYKDLEIIVVDDCSKGNCKEIIDLYRSKGYNNIVYLKNEKNLGSAWARINGASISKGKYIHFIDSDDWVVEECYQKQMKYLNNYFDVLYFNHYIAYNNDIKFENYNKVISTTIIGRRGAFDDMFFNPLQRSRTLWARIFSRKCVLEAPKYMPKIWISIADDWIFNLFILFNARKYKSVSDYLYYYYQDNPIAMTTTAENSSKVNSKKLNTLISQYYSASYSLVNFFINKGIWNKYRINWAVYIATDLQHHFINTLIGFEKNILDSTDKKFIHDEASSFFNSKTTLTHICSFIRNNNNLSYQLSIKKFNQYAIKNIYYIIISTFTSPVRILKTIFDKNKTDNKVYIKLFGFNITLIKK